MNRSQRIGIFGGSFDPIHTGHLRIARAAERQLRLDRLLFIPTRHSPLKKHGHAEHARHRLRMVRRAIEGNRKWRADGSEIRRRGLSYTVATLRSLKRRYPHAALFLIIGSDNLASFEKWREPDLVASMCRVVVYKRPGWPASASHLKRWNARLLRGPAMAISSTDIRARFQAGRSAEGLIPDAVRHIALRLRLYTTRPRSGQRPIGH